MTANHALNEHVLSFYMVRVHTSILVSHDITFARCGDLKRWGDAVVGRWADEGGGDRRRERQARLRFMHEAGAQDKPWL
eukprot:CAMPEP_0183341674 /NCGR_PEP_ID=MMETSP0164_2-20130417/7919_1 /TAXON_ID=221442 /ORGANISM="Coccolithus pelagicus ssp braarudi, Strain PLY182g" /LENGTH=78 /DNA_ID=CAMNT_0025512069 /DNA_START=330 /DNA_END=566 /DNA_ORIENTATION=-